MIYGPVVEALAAMSRNWVCTVGLGVGMFVDDYVVGKFGRVAVEGRLGVSNSHALINPLKKSLGRSVSTAKQTQFRSETE